KNWHHLITAFCLAFRDTSDATLVRRLTNPRIRATSSGADILILAILLIQCILGLTTIPFSAQHPDGSEMMKLVGWAQSIVTFQGGASTHLDGVAFIFRACRLSSTWSRIAE
ncbi:respiratory nitrate reductase subunit gamma, partial [Pseudomonas aeruginosa]|uniref:respiratory nitrate reductase subunit gamma n=1 Tax=Pseudomonas aeruginosa TaxID=287 RepID=UPI0031B73226